MNGSVGDAEFALILRARNDERAFTRLIEMHQAKVRGLLHRLCRNHANADDLAQEVFLVAYQKLSSFQGNGSFEGWLCRIAYRCFLQQHRREARRVEIHEQLVVEQTVDPQVYESISPEQLSLENALRQLVPAEIAAITLCCSYGFSHQEAANALHMPLGSVKSHVNRGKEKMRALLLATPEQAATPEDKVS